MNHSATIVVRRCEKKFEISMEDRVRRYYLWL